MFSIFKRTSSMQDVNLTDLSESELAEVAGGKHHHKHHHHKHHHHHHHHHHTWPTTGTTGTHPGTGTGTTGTHPGTSTGYTSGGTTYGGTHW